MGWKFCFDDKRKRSSTHHMILKMTKYGNHGIRQRFDSDADVKRFFKLRGCYWDDLVQKCRNPNEIVPIVENLIGSTWVVGGSGRATVVTDAATDKEKEITSLAGPGILTASTYLQLFENAVDHFSRCVERASFADFQSCVSSGIASIDAYIVHYAWLYNTAHPTQQLVDSKAKKVSQDDKIDNWIPQMLKGKRLDKSSLNWQNFKKLRTVRDDLAIHLKKPAIGVSYQQFRRVAKFISVWYSRFTYRSSFTI